MKLYGQWGALIGAAGLLVITLLFWRFASVGLVYWLAADATCAAIGTFVGCVVYSSSTH